MLIADPDRGQQRGQADRGPDVAPLGGQSALGQDDHQSGEAERLGQVGVLELDPETRSPITIPSTRNSSSDGQPDPRADPGGDDRRDQHRSTHQQDGVDVDHPPILSDFDPFRDPIPADDGPRRSVTVDWRIVVKSGRATGQPDGPQEPKVGHDVSLAGPQ